MPPIEIIAIVLSVLIVGGVIACSVINKKKGKTGCCSDCASCKYNCGCNDKKEKKGE